ncbi:LIM domain only protein 3 isoform X1 [Podarcis raffonei]|uniref:LIM domain only protein 3 isoform X1 n=1 Tax=Podarcis raffonei TaxID=65483 RepID=UPI0023294F2E|nr:LIM domain only protein 3 isoform X1 [Podarcis raffonei]
MCVRVHNLARLQVPAVCVGRGVAFSSSLFPHPPSLHPLSKVLCTIALFSLRFQRKPLPLDPNYGEGHGHTHTHTNTLAASCFAQCEGATRESLNQLMQKKEKSFGIQMLSVQPDTKPKGCAGCNRKIKDRYLLKALDKYWHEDCLKCACCDCRLGEVGSTLYTKANLILCRRDYLRLFGVTGNCAACSKLIPAFEMVMRAKDNVYHLDCFACQLCNQRFCVGDKFFLKNNMILCQTDYEEGLMKEGYAPQVR